jgi:hypothetical protein
LPTTAAEAYEALRREVLRPGGQIVHAEGRGVLIRSGFAKWAQSHRIFAAPPPPGPSQWRGQPEPVIPPGVETELVKLVAALILNTGQEARHA